MNTESKLHSAFFAESDSSQLQQGDILLTQLLDEAIFKRDGKSGRISETVYPYFFKKYHQCVVLNATCDVIKKTGDRSRNPKVQCVQLVAVGPFLEVFSMIAKRFAGDGHPFRLISESQYVKLTDDFRKILDGQDKTRFFLPSMPWLEEFFGTNYPWIARLDVIIRRFPPTAQSAKPLFLRCLKILPFQSIPC